MASKILQFLSNIFINSKLFLFPTSKSLKSCAGVIFTAPDPFSGSAYSSEIIFIFLLIIGIFANLPINFFNFLFSGWMAIATSPKIVSGLVVPTVIKSDELLTLYLINHISPSTSF